MASQTVSQAPCFDNAFEIAGFVLVRRPGDLGDGPLSRSEPMHAITLERMTDGDIEEAAAFVARCMNEDEGAYARRTMAFHFRCRSCGLDDGRCYYLWRMGNSIDGLVGLHHYVWGPEENVWLAWFAVAPEMRRRGYGRALIGNVERIAVERGYRKLFVETYAGVDFAQARAFYERAGFRRVGSVSGYLPGGEDMVVYGKPL
jgi:GNAT superfamily N-acetyltransferase